MEHYNVAVIGCANPWGLGEDDPREQRPRSHAEALIMNPRTTLVAACDSDVSTLHAFGRQWNVRALFTDHLEMLARHKPHIICVTCTPTEYETIVVDAALFGIPAVLFSAFHSSGPGVVDRLMAFCKRHGIAPIINLRRERRMHHWAARRILESGKLGTLRTLVGSAFPGSAGPESDADPWGSPVALARTRLLALFHYLGGAIEWVIGHEHRPWGLDTPESDCLAMVHFTNGVHGFIEAGGRRRHHQFSVDVQCTHGRILLDQEGLRLFMPPPGDLAVGPTELTPVRLPRMDAQVNTVAMDVDETLACLDGRKDPLGSATTAREVLAVVDAIHTSSLRGGRMVYLTALRKTRESQQASSDVPAVGPARTLGELPIGTGP